MALTLLLTVGCVTRAVNTSSSADTRLYQEHLERPAWLEGMSEEDVRARVMAALDTPVEFHGVVEDDTGEPVPGATVSFALFDHALSPFEFPYVGWTELPEQRTDRRGRVSLRDVRGTALYVRVHKDGYKSVNNSKRHLRYAERLRSLNEYALPTEAMPMRFVLTPGAPLEDYYRVNSGAVPLPEDGGEVGYRVDAHDPYGVDPADGHFAVACDKGNPRPDGRWDWSCRLRMIGAGGVQVRHDLVLEQAPAEGYAQDISFGFSADDANWDHRDERFLYVSLDEGAYFGHLVLKVRTAGDFFFDVEGMVNRTGSRELETLYHHSAR